MEIALLFGRWYGNVEGQRLLLYVWWLDESWVIYRAFDCRSDLSLAVVLMHMKEASPSLWLLLPLHWTRRLRSLLSLVMSVSSLNFWRKFRGDRMWNLVCFPSDQESADSECSLYRCVVSWLACRMWLELQNHWRHEEADIDPTTAVQCRKSFSVL